MKDSLKIDFLTYNQEYICLIICLKENVYLKYNVLTFLLLILCNSILLNKINYFPLINQIIISIPFLLLY